MVVLTKQRRVASMHEQSQSVGSQIPNPQLWNDSATSVQDVDGELNSNDDSGFDDLDDIDIDGIDDVDDDDGIEDDDVDEIPSSQQQQQQPPRQQQQRQRQPAFEMESDDDGIPTSLPSEPKPPKQQSVVTDQQPQQEQEQTQQPQQSIDPLDEINQGTPIETNDNNNAPRRSLFPASSTPTTAATTNNRDNTRSRFNISTLGQTPTPSTGVKPLDVYQNTQRSSTELTRSLLNKQLSYQTIKLQNDQRIRTFANVESSYNTIAAYQTKFLRRNWHLGMFEQMFAFNYPTEWLHQRKRATTLDSHTPAARLVEKKQRSARNNSAYVKNMWK